MVNPGLLPISVPKRRRADYHNQRDKPRVKAMEDRLPSRDKLPSLDQWGVSRDLLENTIRRFVSLIVFFWRCSIWSPFTFLWKLGWGSVSKVVKYIIPYCSVSSSIAVLLFYVLSCVTPTLVITIKNVTSYAKAWIPQALLSFFCITFVSYYNEGFLCG